MDTSRNNSCQKEYDTPKNTPRRSLFNRDCFRLKESILNDNCSSPELFIFGNDESNRRKTNRLFSEERPASNTNTVLMQDSKKCPKTPEINKYCDTPPDKNYQAPVLNSPYSKPSKARLLQDLNSRSAFARIRALQALKNPGQFISEPDPEEEIIAPQETTPRRVTRLSDVLIGVIVYVEVRNKDFDNSEGVKEMMKRLGATVHNNFLKDVTHVVFKDGRVSTYKKAMERNIPLVSMLWIEACKMQMCKVDEALYPATGLEDYKTMALLNKRGKPVRRLAIFPSESYQKKTQVKEKADPEIRELPDNTSQNNYEDSNNTSFFGFSDATDKISQAEIEDNTDLCENNITRSNVESDDLETQPLAVRLMKKFMAQRILNNEPSENIQLFENKCAYPAVPDTNKISDMLSKISVSNSGIKTKANLYMNPKRFSCFSPNSNTLTDTTSDSFRSTDIITFNPASPIKKKRRISCIPNFESNDKTDIENAQISNSSSNFNFTSSTAETDSSVRLRISITSEESKTTEESIDKSCSKSLDTEEVLKEINLDIGKVLSNRRMSMRVASRESLYGTPRTLSDKDNSQGKKMGRSNMKENVTSQKNGEKDVNTKKPFHASLSDKNATNSTIFHDEVIEKPIELEEIDEVNERPYFDSPSVNENSKIKTTTDATSPKIIRKRKLFTMTNMVDLSQINNAIASPKVKDNYFNITPKKKQNEKGLKTKHVTKVNSQKPKPNTTINSYFFPESNSATSQVLTDSLFNNLSAVVPERRSTLDFQKKPSKEELKEKAQKKKPVIRCVTNIVCTSLRSSELEFVKNIINILGVYELSNEVNPSTSHVISLEPRRTLNMLKGIVRGCWIVNFDWVLKSEQAGKWVGEDLYEWKSFSPAIQRTRAERKAFGNSYKMDIFSTCGSIYVGKKCSPPCKELKLLITLCCGKIESNYRVADIIIGEFYNNVLCVSPSWILDSIMDYKVKSINSYIINVAL